MGLVWISSYVIRGADKSFYVTYNDKLIKISDNFVKLFKIQESDLIEGWVDEELDILVSIDAINGNFIVI